MSVKRPRNPQDEVRLQRRNRLLLWTAPALLLVLLLAVKLFSLPILSNTAEGSFIAGKSEPVIAAGQGQSVVNIVDPWKAHFTLGDGYMLSKNFDKARQEFATALEGKPGIYECQVRHNLALSIEHLGDQSENKDKAAAKKFYQDALQVIKEAPKGCFVPNDPANQKSEGQALDKAKDRLEPKASPSEGAEDDPSPEPTPQPSEADEPAAGKVEQLKKKAEDAAKERAKGKGSPEQGSGQESNPYPKPW